MPDEATTPKRLTIVFGSRDDLAGLAALGDLWAEATATNVVQLQALQAAGIAATSFQAGDVLQIIDSADEHHPKWSTLVVLR